MGVVELIAGIFKPAAELVDELHTERELIEAKGKIIHAEASSKHWLTANWRPITMLTFLALAVGDSMGWLSSPLRDEAWMLLQIGLSGYLISRSGEKIASTIATAKKYN